MRLAFLLPVAALCAVASAQTVTRVDLTRDNGSGKPGAVVKSLSPQDNPFHCVIHMKAITSGMTFTGTLIAVKAGSVTNYRVASTDLGASAGMDLVDFKFSLPRPWPTGSYRVDVKANGKELKSITFEVK